MNNKNEHTHSEFEELLLKWLDGEATDRELAILKASEEFEAYESIAENSKNIFSPKPNSDKIFQNIQKQIAQKPKAKLFTLRKIIPAVAAIGLLVFAATFLFSGKVVVKSKDAIHISHALPDGSQIILNSESRISYEKDFKDERVLFLEGEAFFQVEKGKKFVVKTKNGKVTVLGTSFNVYNRGDVLSVACKTGKVRVETKKDRVVLTKGKKVRMSSNKTSGVQSIQANAIDMWTEGESYFESTPLIDVISSLSYKYGTKINLPSQYHNLTFTGSFIHHDIEKALKMVLLPMGVSYKVMEDDRVEILDK